MPQPNEEVDTIIILRNVEQRIRDLTDNVLLLMSVDRLYAQVYTALMTARQDTNTGNFLDEFSTANTLEQQAEVLQKWAQVLV